MLNRVLILPLLFVPAVGLADALPINPGMWETTMTRTDFMSGQPVTETLSECVKDTEFDPASVVRDMQGCILQDSDLRGDTLNFRMACSEQGGMVTIDGTFQSDGRTGKGNMNMDMEFGGQSMQMDMKWTARRVGDC